MSAIYKRSLVGTLLVGLVVMIGCGREERQTAPADTPSSTSEPVAEQAAAPEPEPVTPAQELVAAAQKVADGFGELAQTKAKKADKLQADADKVVADAQEARAEADQAAAVRDRAQQAVIAMVEAARIADEEAKAAQENAATMARGNELLDAMMQQIETAEFTAAEQSLSQLDGIKDTLPASMQQQIEAARALLGPTPGGDVE